MTDARLEEIEKLIEDAGRCFDPATGLFEPIDEVDMDGETDTDFDLASFLGLLGISQDECAEYVQRKMHDSNESFPET